MEMTIERLNVGFNADVEVINHNEFVITGDITATVTFDYNGIQSGVKTKKIDSLRVVYNHDGLLEHIYDGDPNTPDNILLFRDVETYVNMSHRRNDLECGNTTRDVLITDDNSINVYAEIFIEP